MSTSNAHLQNAQPSNQNPDPSAQGNTPSDAASQGVSQPQTDPQIVPPPASRPAPPAQANGSRGSVRFEDLSPEAQAYSNTASAAARREGEATGRKDASNEAADQIRELTTRAETAERERDSIRMDFWRLKAALKVNLPNPVQNALRLRGETEEALEQDAETFLADLSGQIPRPTVPPITPAGGNSPPASDGGSQPPSDLAPRTDADAYAAQRSSAEYDMI